MANKPDNEKREETERRIDLAVAFLQEAIAARMSAGTWGKVTIVAVVEAGFVKEVVLDDNTVIRDLPKDRAAKKPTERLTAPARSA